jgi:hypothetical protein
MSAHASSVATPDPGRRRSFDSSPARPAGPQRDATAFLRDEPAGGCTRIRLADGRIVDAPLAPERQRRIHLGLLHADSDGYVEIAGAVRPPGSKMRMVTRKQPEYFRPGGATGDRHWLDGLLALVASEVARGREVAVAPAVRAQPAGYKAAVAHTRWLWVDVDGSEQLCALWDLLERKPAQLVVASAGSGGVHAYWRLREPLWASPPMSAAEAQVPARRQPIERANRRLIYALGYELDACGRPHPTVADERCQDRSRVLRLAGTTNGKSGRLARIVWADLAHTGWSLRELVGDLADPPQPARRRRPAGAPVAHNDPHKRIAPAEYFRRLAGIEVPERGLVSCPNPAHADTTPSCHVGGDAGEGWCCHGCGAGGAIYDLASVLLGGPTGQWLRGEQFRRAREHVIRTFGSA